MNIIYLYACINIFLYIFLYFLLTFLSYFTAILIAVPRKPVVYVKLQDVTTPFFFYIFHKR